MSANSASNSTIQVTYDLTPLSDEQLVGLSLADLRNYLWGLPGEEAKRLKERRRKLKNRRNSATWRKKHLDQWGKLEEQNTILKWEVQNLAQENALLRLQLKVLQDPSKPLQSSAACMTPIKSDNSPECLVVCPRRSPGRTLGSAPTPCLASTRASPYRQGGDNCFCI
uniref:Basic leucine zipper domain-containing protein n=1 Tax=Gopherus evgoodei TaxID=1825980 RepID=A0A8C4WEM3_9SAUR